MELSQFDYDLPAKCIAQRAVEPRDHSRLMVLNRTDGTIQHRRFHNLPDYLESGDVLVLNDTRVMPYHLVGRRASGGKVDGLLIEKIAGDTWRAMFRSRGRLRAGERLQFFDDRLMAELVSKDEEAIWTVRMLTADADSLIERFGLAPLPPYIKRTGDNDAALADYDRERYQTTFARVPGAIAAPTAGMHFTRELLDRIASIGVEIVTVTLHVGLGTFQPIRVEKADQHQMHTESYEVAPQAAESLKSALDEHRRIVAVGTTSVRVLEHCTRDGTIQAETGQTNLFIHPPHEFRAVGTMVTNFHLPRSTLMMLVCAFAGTEAILSAYRTAIAEGYRFYSYGDAMLIL